MVLVYHASLTVTIVVPFQVFRMALANLRNKVGGSMVTKMSWFNAHLERM